MRIDLQNLWTPLPTQQAFLQRIAECPVNEFRSVAYVGALGSGKSWALCRAAIGLALSYPKMRILIGRHHSTDLRDTTQTTFFELISEIEEYIKFQYPIDLRDNVPPIGEMHKAINEYEFNNGSVILFRPLDEAEKKYKSLNIAAVGIDEASEVDNAAVQMIMSRRRQLGYPLIFFVVSNPTSYSHWLYKWFVKNETPTELKAKNTFIFRTNTAENKKHLPHGYIQELTRRYPADWIRRYLEGEWGGVEEGAPIYASFDPKIHVATGLLYRNNPVWVGIDFGYQSPGVVWAHPDRQYRCQIVREWSPKQIGLSKMIEGILKRNDIWFPNARFEYFCGHDKNQHNSATKETPTDILAKSGIIASYLHHRKESGFTVIRNLLRVRDDDKPMLTVDPFCDILIEGFMGEYKYKPDKDGTREDEPLKNGIHDPLHDAFRYIAYQNYTESGDPPGEAPHAIKAFGTTKGLNKRYGRNQSDDYDKGWKRTKFVRPR